MKSAKKQFKLSIVLIIILLVVIGCGKKEKATTNESANLERENMSQETESKESIESTETTKSTSTSDIPELPTGHTADKLVIGFVDVTGTGLISDTLGIARDKGFVEEELNKIDVKAEFVAMTGAGPAINEALASKNLDVGFLGDVPAIIGKANGIDTQVISFSGLNNGASLVVHKGSGLTSVNDLKGKKIATQKGAYMHKVLIDILSATNLTTEDIEFVNLNAQSSAEAFITGNVDGIVVGGSTLSKLIEDGTGEVLVDYREHPEWACGSYGIARTDYINDNPDIIKALVRALVRAQQLAKEDYTVLKDQWLSTGNSEISYEYLYPNHDNYYEIEKTDKSIASGKDTIQFLLDNKLITSDFVFDDWINSSFYEAAYRELGK
jgi:ABC-type nitrate/sulfonate/bicarbonate transport system substrate-binding protein